MRFRTATTSVLILAATLLSSHSSASPVQGISAQNYVVLYRAQSVPADAAKSMLAAGGTLVYSYGQIGVAIASSYNADFAQKLMKDSRVDSVAATQTFATQSVSVVNGANGGPVVVNTPMPGSDSLSGLQWDMVQIHAPEARAVNGGNKSVLVGVI